ncbi:unnamed protein product [Cochlearia groenlandica]
MTKISYMVVVIVTFYVFVHVVEAYRPTNLEEEVAKKNDAVSPATTTKLNEDVSKGDNNALSPTTTTDLDENVVKKDYTLLGPTTYDKKELKKDLHEAKDLIEDDVKKKESNIKTLEEEVRMLTKSETTLNELEDALKNGKNLAPYGKKLKKFNRKIKHAPKQVKCVSVIQSILKDLGLNGGR